MQCVCRDGVSAAHPLLAVTLLEIFCSPQSFSIGKPSFGEVIDGVPRNYVMMDISSQSSQPASRLHPDGNVATTNWITNTFYEGSGCTGSVMTTKALSTAFCYKLTDDSTVFYTYACNSSAIIKQKYSDSACTVKRGPPNLHSPSINYCFATDVDDDGYINSNGGWDSNMYTCTTGYPTDTMPAASITRNLFQSSDCSQDGMINVQTGLQDMCYTNYNGRNYSSFIFTTPYLFDYSGENCNAANTVEVTYLDTSGACVNAGDGGFATYSMSGTNADDDENDDNNGVGKDMLAIAIVFSFIGGVILTAVGVFCWFKFGRKPLGAQGDTK
eukprot:gene6928-7664_t